MKHTKENCMACGVELTAPDNWYLSRINKREYRCISCFDHRRVENRIKRGEKSPSLYAKFFGTKHEKEYASISEGFIYILTNPAWKGWLKIGMAIDANDRHRSYQTSSPLRDYVLEYKKFFTNRSKAEQEAHKQLIKNAIIFNGEWFQTSVKEAKKIIEAI